MVTYEPIHDMCKITIKILFTPKWALSFLSRRMFLISSKTEGLKSASSLFKTPQGGKRKFE
jgi:hypothetical protein